MIRFKDDNCVFRVWAPEKEALSLYLVDDDRVIDMEKDSASFSGAQTLKTQLSSLKRIISFS